MSAREGDRLKVLYEVRKRLITQKQAAVELELSVRWVRTLLKRLGAGRRQCAATKAARTGFEPEDAGGGCGGTPVNPAGWKAGGRSCT